MINIKKSFRNYITILPPLHIKLDSIKLFQKALNKEEGCFDCIYRKYPLLNMKQVFLNDCKSNKTWKIHIFKILLTILIQRHGLRSLWRQKNFLWNYKVEHHSKRVKSMLFSFRQLGCKMSIKVQYFHCHLDPFSKNLEDHCEENGECFQQNIRTMKGHCQ